MPRENFIKTEGTEKRKDGEVLEEMERSRDQELGVPFPHVRDGSCNLEQLHRQSDHAAPRQLPCIGSQCWNLWTQGVVWAMHLLALLLTCASSFRSKGRKKRKANAAKLFFAARNLCFCFWFALNLGKTVKESCWVDLNSIETQCTLRGDRWIFLFAAAATSLQSCPTLCDPVEAAHQAPPSLGFSRQEH